MSVQASDLWTKLTAVGTLSASVIALAVAVSPPLWRRYWQRPRLKVHLGEHEPWARVTRSGTSGSQQAWLRIEVANDGRAEARNVRAVVHAWFERADTTAHWEKRDLDPSALHWVSMPHTWQDDGSGARLAPAVNLPRSLSDFADLIVFTFDNNEQRLVLDDPRPRGFGLRPTNDNGEFVLTITVVAENAETLRRHIHYSLTRERLFSDVRFVDSAPADYRFTGLLAGIEQWRQQRSEVPPPSPE